MSMPLTTIKKRIVVLLAIFAIALVALIIRIGYWQMYRGAEMRAAAEKQQTSSSAIIAARGTIYDRNGKTLAESATVNTLVCNPSDIREAQKKAEKSARENGEETPDYSAMVAEELSVILNMDYDKIYELLTKPNKYQVIKKRLTVEEAEQIKNIKSSEDDELLKKAFTGVYFEEDTKRYYSYNIAPHLIGFTGYDNTGLLGIEMTFDRELSGMPGAVTNSQNASGSSNDDAEYEEYFSSGKGADVVTTVDETIQHILENHLEEAVKDSRLKEGAAGIIMNPKTGEILAMATKPDFDCNDPYNVSKFDDMAVNFEFESKVMGRVVDMYDGVTEKDRENAILYPEPVIELEEGAPTPTPGPPEVQFDSLTPEEQDEVLTERIAAMRNKMWRNKVISDSYEPGSTFKTLVAAAALEEGIVDINTPFRCPGFKIVLGQRIHCHASGHGDETFIQGVQNSCNPVFMETGLMLGNDRFMEYFSAFGLTEKTGIELVGETDSIYYKNTMTDLDLAVSSFGQGFNLTPIQLCTAVSAVVNGGNLMKPQIVKEIRNEHGVIKSYQPQVVSKVISESTSKEVREILETVVSAPNGTAKNAYIKGYHVGGKTGTSEKGNRDEHKRIASFVGFAPADDPQIVCLVMLDEPQTGKYYGGSIAAPLVGSVIEESLEYLGVKRKYSEGETGDRDIEIKDVRELGISEASEILTSSGLIVKVEGEGDTIVDQLPKPGVMLSKGSMVILYTEKTTKKTVTVPNVKGLSAQEAKEKINNAGLNFETVGSGNPGAEGAYAVKQSQRGGKKVQAGTIIGVEFRTQASD